MQSTYSRRLLEAAKLPSGTTDLIGEITQLDDRVVPIVHRLQDYQRADGSIEPRQVTAADAALSALRGELHRSALFSGRSREAFDDDLAKWRAEGLESPPRFDASRDAIEGPDDKEVGMYAGPAHMPNSGSNAPLFQLAVIMRDEPSSLAGVRATYPHQDSLCQMTRVLTGSRQAKDGQCVVLFPENVPASSEVIRQKFAWFFMNKHIPTYQWTLARIRERCGDNLFAEGDPLASPLLDDEAMYDARCCWAHLHEHHHQTGCRPLASNLALKTQPYTALLEELKVDCQSVQACLRDPAIPCRWEVIELVLFDRLLRYPCAGDAQTNDDAGAGVLLGTWLLRRGVVTSRGGWPRLASRAEAGRAIDALVDEIQALEERDDAAYAQAAEAFTLSVLGPPGRENGRYAKPADWLASVFAITPGTCPNAGDGNDLSTGHGLQCPGQDLGDSHAGSVRHQS